MTDEEKERESPMKSSDETDLRRATLRIALLWKTMMRHYLAADFSENDSLVLRWAESRIPSMNVVIASPETSDKEVVRLCLQRAGAYMRSRSRPGITLICRERLNHFNADELVEVIATSGLRKGSVFVEMVGEAPTIAGTTHSALHFSRIVDDTGVRVFADITSEARGLPLEAGQESILQAHDLYKAAYSFIAYRGIEPVSACSYLVVDGGLYLAWVGTRPNERKKGYASAVVSHALSEAHQATGLMPTDLHATEAGKSVYGALGYRPSVIFQHYYLST
jgi:GNAT superfamily N-acetyltransferase